MLRYIVERISDGAFLELELPIIVSGAGRKRGGPAGFSGEIVPIVDAYRYAGTDALIVPGGTYIHEEADGVIRGTWIVTRSSFQGASWKIEGDGVSRVFSGRAYKGEFWGVQVDPIAVARHVVEEAQAVPGAQFGITLTGSSSVRVGTDSDLKANAAKQVMDQRKKAWDVYARPRVALQARVRKLSKPHDDAIRVLNRDRRVLYDAYAAAIAGRLPAAEIAARKALVTAKDADIKARRSVKSAAVKDLKDQIADLEITEAPLKESYEAAKEDYETAKDQAEVDEGAWKLLWWDTPDSLDAINEAVEAAGYEWVEWSGWNSARTRILKEIRCVPRVGAKRDNIAFTDDNIIDQVTVEDDATTYANAVIAIGAGEGKAALRVEVGKPDGRPYWPVTVDGKHLTKKAALEAFAWAELGKRQRAQVVKAVRVDASHSNARRGTFDVGDTVLLDVDAGWAGRVRVWRRIEEIEWVGLDIADLMLEGG
ncbi:siphovirus ReqiPepy6 Gp37-like family protein [Leucobacter allii]|uniref:Siphovirus ReqiPepy6 Gp37-like family protein n=1 Tax=Leucobacter allii TaxID=2932247 RepID=A0ABY4FHC2_9MICO|nr:siphovirus ReqiPepy6 Gp37-like family protein [Leucobacter allii]UOQ56065.1 siphovirus ReqiPepy6 Gp37-like family protein [Leucobacter allii]